MFSYLAKNLNIQKRKMLECALNEMRYIASWEFVKLSNYCVFFFSNHFVFFFLIFFVRLSHYAKYTGLDFDDKIKSC